MPVPRGYTKISAGENLYFRAGPNSNLENVRFPPCQPAADR
jgi:hypothetical protein